MVPYIFLYILNFFLALLAIWLIELEGAATYPIGILIINILFALRRTYSLIAKKYRPRLLVDKYYRDAYLVTGYILISVQLAWSIWTVFGVFSITSNYTTKISNLIIDLFYYCSTLFIILIIIRVIIGVYTATMDKPVLKELNHNSTVINKKTVVEQIKDMDKNIFSTDDTPSCAICLENYKETDNIRRLGCTHFYHLECIDNWLLNSQLCPICKQDIKSAQNLLNV